MFRIIELGTGRDKPFMENLTFHEAMKWLWLKANEFDINRIQWLDESHTKLPPELGLEPIFSIRFDAEVPDYMLVRQEDEHETEE